MTQPTIVTTANYKQLALRTECDQYKAYAAYAGKDIRLLRLNHAVIGMMSDYYEYLEAKANADWVNLKEELGDLFWYIAIAADALDMELVFERVMDQDPEKHFLRELATLAYYVEKTCHYRKTVPLYEAVNAVQALCMTVCSLCAECGFNFREVLEANIRKLQARYPQKFTEFLAAPENRDRLAEAKAVENVREARAADDGVCYEEC